jgi:hypothetical protein
MAEILFGTDTSGEYDEPVASPLYDKLDELEGQALHAAERYARRRRRRTLLHWALGLPAIVVAGVAAGGVLTGRLSDLAIASCAIAAAVLTALQTFVRPDRAALFAHTQQLVMRRLAMEASLTRDGLEDLTHPEAHAAVSRLWTSFFDARNRSVRDGAPG